MTLPQQGDDPNVTVPDVVSFARGDRVIMRIELPGFEAEEIRLEIEEGVLALRGEHVERWIDREPGRSTEETARTLVLLRIQLAPGADPATAVATMRDGVLQMSMACPRAAYLSAQALSPESEVGSVRRGWATSPSRRIRPPLFAIR
jgi:HSP20 family molecular chaperone IbpA